ncbi:MAG TPA: DUF6318 family protein [Mycobacteriales bacterium]|nr:DUF6318 family protein [Mycobacteriales bacterium]
MSATPTGAPPLPAAAREETETGAEAFAKYYIEIDNYVINARDLKPEEELFDPDECSRCKSIVDAYRKSLDKGEYIQGGNYTVTSSKAIKVKEKIYLVTVKYDRDPVQLFNKNGQKVGGLVAAIQGQEALVTLNYREGRWRVSAFDQR